MFGRKEKPPAQAMSADKIETIVGATASFNGQLKSEGGIRIDGCFDGVVETAGNIIIGEGAKVNADLSARNISVGGLVRGNITASGRLEILSSGRVYGDIQVSSFLIDEGGVFRGQSLMQPADEPLMIEAPQPAYAPAIAPTSDAKPAAGGKPEKQRNNTPSGEPS